MERVTIPAFDFEGIPRIEIPKQDSDFNGGDYGLSIIKDYLPRIMSSHQKNADKEKYLYEYSNGKQDILEKTRLYSKDSQNNNKIIENHAFRQKNFKIGYITSENREYTHKYDSNSDDLTYIDRYNTDINFFPKDKDLKDWIYSTGVGVTYTRPRTDIIAEKGFITDKNVFNIEYEAPYTYDVLDPRENFVVYSSSSTKEPLFCVSIVDEEYKTTPESSPATIKRLLVETKYAYFKVGSSDNFTTFNDELRLVNTKSLHYMPMIEYAVNMQRMGIVELNRELFNTINLVKSCELDMTVDNANPIFVFKNVDITSEDVQKMKAAGAIIIGNPEAAANSVEAGFEVIKIEVPFDGLNQFYETTLTQAYDIAGVPLATSNVTSGGDTGQARLIGGGWNNAYIIANNDINSLLASDYEQLKLFLLLAKQYPNSPVNDLYASQVDIKYRVNQSDNFVVKTQGIRYLYDCHIPKKAILKASRLFDDVTTLAAEWEAEDQKAAEAAKNDGVIIENNPIPEDNNSKEQL